MGRMYEMKGLGERGMVGGSGKNFGGEGGRREWMKTIEEMRDRKESENGEEDVDDGKKGMDERSLMMERKKWMKERQKKRKSQKEELENKLDVS